MGYDFQIIDKTLKMKTENILCPDGKQLVIDIEDSVCVTTKGLPCNIPYHGSIIKCDKNLKPVNRDDFKFYMTYNYSDLLYKLPNMEEKGIRTLYDKSIDECIKLLEDGCRYLKRNYISVWNKSIRGDKSLKHCFLSSIYNRDIPKDLDIKKFNKYLIDKDGHYYDLTNVDPKDKYVLDNIKYFTDGYPLKMPSYDDLKNQKDIFDDYWCETPCNVFTSLDHILNCLYWICENYTKEEYSNFTFKGD